MVIPKKPKVTKAEPAAPMASMSTTRFELGLEILTELDTPSLMALLEEHPEGTGDEEAGAIVGLLASALKGRLLRRLSAVALATEDELEAAENDDARMGDLVKARGRASFSENLQAVKDFFTRLGFSNLATLASLAGPLGGKRPAEGVTGAPSEEPSPSGV